MSKNPLDPRHERLEQVLNNSPRITLKDRFNRLGEHMMINKGWYAFAGLSIAAAVVGSDILYDNIHHMDYILMLESESANLSNLNDLIHQAKELGVDVILKSECLESTAQNFNQASLNNAPYAGEILESVYETMKTFTANSEIMTSSESLNSLEEHISTISYSLCEKLGYGFFSTTFALVGTAITMKTSNTTNRAPDYDPNKVSGIKLKLALPKLRKKLANHQYANQIYEFLDECIENGLQGDNLLSAASTLIPKINEENVDTLNEYTSNIRISKCPQPSLYLIKHEL